MTSDKNRRRRRVITFLFENSIFLTAGSVVVFVVARLLGVGPLRVEEIGTLPDGAQKAPAVSHSLCS